MGEVMRNFGRNVIIDLGWSITGEISDDHWEVIQIQNISAWSEALTVLEEGTKRFGDEAFDFVLDWSPVVAALDEQL